MFQVGGTVYNLSLIYMNIFYSNTEPDLCLPENSTCASEVCITLYSIMCNEEMC